MTGVLAQSQYRHRGLPQDSPPGALMHLHGFRLAVNQESKPQFLQNFTTKSELWTSFTILVLPGGGHQTFWSVFDG